MDVKMVSLAPLSATKSKKAHDDVVTSFLRTTFFTVRLASFEKRMLSTYDLLSSV